MKKLQTDIDEQTKSYNHFKQEVISVRNKEKSADDKLKRIKLQLDKLEQPMVNTTSNELRCFDDI